MKPATALILLSPLPLVVNAAAADPAAFEVRAVNPRDASPAAEPTEVIAARQETTPPSRTLVGETAPGRTLSGSNYCIIL